MKIINVLFIIFFLINISFAREDVLRPKGKFYHDDDYRRKITLGVEAGLNYNMFNQNMTWNELFLHGSIFDPLTTAQGVSPCIGAMIDVPLDNTFGIQLKLAYDVKNFSRSSTGSDYDLSGVAHDMILEVSAKSAYFTITPLLRINASENLFFTIGPTIHTIVGPIETTWKPEVSDGTSLNSFAYFNYLGFGAASRGSVTLSTDDANSIEKPNSPRIGLEGGIGYKFNLSSNVFLVPQVRLQLMFTPITNDTELVDINDNTILQTTDRMLSSLQLALALWFEF